MGKKPLKKLVYELANLTGNAKKFLRTSWCIDDNPNHLWLSKESILEAICDESGEDLKEVPESFWGKLELDENVKKEIEKLWKDDEKNEVEWKW